MLKNVYKCYKITMFWEEIELINYSDEYTKKVKNEIGGKNYKYNINTFGCELNINDSEKISGMLEDMGFLRTDDYNEANIIIFNTCCVRENAEERLFGKLGEIKRLNEENGTIVAIGGCMMQEPVMVEKLKKSYKYVDIIFGTHTIQNLPENIYKALIERKKVKDVIDIDGEIVEGIPVKRNDKYKASVTIMYGCNKFCTYCIVPYVRGRERSRAPETIISEIEELSKEGYKEITLLGQNVNSYVGNDKVRNFAELLDEVAKIKGIEIIRFESPYPSEFKDDVIDVMARNKNISRVIHMPLQAGNNKVLKEMNRRYTKEEFLDLVDRVKRKIPEAVFSTDIIVGFPGETDEEFEDTLDIVRRVDFEQIYMYIYSKREGTIAAKRVDQVPEDIKHKRFDRLKELYDARVDEINNRYIGTIQEILIEGPSKNNKNMLTGRTDSNKVVVFKPNEKKTKGDLVKVKILSNHKWYLEGEII